MKITVKKDITYNLGEMSQVEAESLISALTTVANNKQNYTDVTYRNCSYIRLALLENLTNG